MMDDVLGCQTWAPTKEYYRKLEICQRSIERSMLNIKISNRIKHTIIRSKTKLENVTYLIKRYKWRWTGYTMRGAEKCSKAMIEWYHRNQKTKRGRQFKRWEDDIKTTAGPLPPRTEKNGKKWKRPLPK